MKLKNAKHERFCQEYIIDLNGAKAAERSGYSKKTARTQANQLLTKLDISKRVAELKEIRSERTVITQDMVLKELRILAKSDIQDYLEVVNELVTDGGTLKLPEGRVKLKVFAEMKGNATRAIKGITEKITKDGIQLSFTLHGKEHSLELLGKHIGMFVEKHEFSGEVQYVLSDKFIPKTGNEKK